MGYKYLIKLGLYVERSCKKSCLFTLASVNIRLIFSLHNLPTSSRSECEALFDYVSATEGDLSFVTGDVIVVNTMKGEWWQGTLNGNSGMFPANYVKLREKVEVCT